MSTPAVRVLVVFHSNFGHVETLARAVAEGASALPGTQVRLRWFPELAESRANLESMGPVATGFHDEVRRRTDGTPDATPEDLEWAHGIAWGSPSFFGAACVQMRMFLERTGTLWFRGALEDKPTGVFTSVGSTHGGHESMIVSTMVSLLHHGMVLLGSPYAENPEIRTVAALGGSPYGPSTIATPDLSRPVAEPELAVARRLGNRIARHAVHYRSSRANVP